MKFRGRRCSFEPCCWPIHGEPLTLVPLLASKLWDSYLHLYSLMGFQTQFVRTDNSFETERWGGWRKSEEHPPPTVPYPCVAKQNKNLCFKWSNYQCSLKLFSDRGGETAGPLNIGCNPPESRRGTTYLQSRCFGLVFFLTC